MKLRYGIFFTILLLLTSSWLSGPMQLNVYYIVIGASALWCAVDSRRIQIRQYNTQLALPPLAILAVVSVAWPIAFPLYLRTRHRIHSGQIEQRPYQAGMRPLFWIAAAFAVFVIYGYFTTREVRQSLMPVAVAVNEAFSIPVNVSRQQTRLTLTVPYEFAPDSARDQFEFAIASCAKKHYKEFVSSVAIRYVQVARRGAITTTRFTDGQWWGANALEATCPGPEKLDITTS